MFHPGMAARWLTIYFFQDVSTFDQKLEELKDRVYHLTVIVFDNVTFKKEGSDEVILEAMNGIERIIKDQPMYAQAS